MSLRHDPAYAAAEVAVLLRRVAETMGGHQVCTVGKIDLHPNLINVVPARATMTLDMRNTDESLLRESEVTVEGRLRDLAHAEGVTITSRPLARFEPVVFDESVVGLVEQVAGRHGHSSMRLPSGAGHDAQMLARVCPTGMIFVQSHKGISHNPAEHTSPEDLEAGANVLLHVILELSAQEDRT